MTELERDAAAQRAGRAAFETEVREMASVELEKRVGIAMQQIEVATHKLTGMHARVLYLSRTNPSCFEFSSVYAVLCAQIMSTLTSHSASKSFKK